MSEVNFENMDTILVTYGINGYPKNIERMISADNFDSVDELFDFADKHYLDVVRIYRKNGWKLWEYQGEVLVPYELRDDDYGENYMVLKKEDKDYIPELLGCNTFSEIEDDKERLRLLKFITEVYNDLTDIDDNWCVVVNTSDKRTVHTIKLKPLCFAWDSQEWSYAIKFPKNE